LKLKSPYLLLNSCIALALLLSATLGSRDILSKGQILKQFYTHELSLSLASNGFQIFKTTIPCKSNITEEFPRPWIEEPPLYNLLAAGIKTIGLSDPAISSFLLFLINVFLIYLCLIDLKLFSKEKSLLITLLVSASPALMRYSTQHIPDPIAVTFLLLGYLLLKRSKPFFALSCFILATLGKVFYFIPSTALGAYFFLNNAKASFKKIPYTKIFTAGFLIGFPFLIWVYLMKTNGIESGYDTGNITNNRHFGDYFLLFDLHYWARIFNWIVIKGIGWISFLGLLLFIYKQTWKTQSAFNFLIAWGLSIIPYACLFRTGGSVHDYYYLPFIVPLSVIGFYQIFQIKNKWVLAFLIFIHVGIGINEPLALTPSEIQPAHLCEAEG